MSFEVFVRPYVSPSIRPAGPALVSVPASTPEQDICVLNGLGGKLQDLTLSIQNSTSKSKPVETERVVDVQRIYQKEDDGTVNKDNFVDVETAKSVTMQEGSGVETKYRYSDPPPADNIETLQTDVKIENPKGPQEVQGGSGAP